MRVACTQKYYDEVALSTTAMWSVDDAVSSSKVDWCRRICLKGGPGQHSDTVHSPSCIPIQFWKDSCIMQKFASYCFLGASFSQIKPWSKLWSCILYSSTMLPTSWLMHWHDLSCFLRPILGSSGKSICASGELYRKAWLHKFCRGTRDSSLLQILKCFEELRKLNANTAMVTQHIYSIRLVYSLWGCSRDVNYASVSITWVFVYKVIRYANEVECARGICAQSS